jgi:hypothetical protein
MGLFFVPLPVRIRLANDGHEVTNALVLDTVSLHLTLEHGDLAGLAAALEIGAAPSETLTAHGAPELTVEDLPEVAVDVSEEGAILGQGGMPAGRPSC